MTFESFREKIDDVDQESINELIPFQWNPNDPQIYRNHKTTKKPNLFDDLSDNFIYRIEGDRKTRGGMSELIEILPSWQNFTDRKKSLVSTSSLDYAKNWDRNGSVYKVIPLKDEIFVSPNRDFNLGDPNAFPKLSILGEDLSNSPYVIIKLSVYRLYKLIHKKWISMGKSLNNFFKENHFKEIVEELGKIVRREKTLIDINPEKYKETITTYKNLYDYIQENNFKNGIEFLDDILNPKDNGFRKMKYTDYIQELKSNPDTNNEVWFMSDCILLK